MEDRRGAYPRYQLMRHRKESARVIPYLIELDLPIQLLSELRDERNTRDLRNVLTSPNYEPFRCPMLHTVEDQLIFYLTMDVPDERTEKILQRNPQMDHLMANVLAVLGRPGERHYLGTDPLYFYNHENRKFVANLNIPMDPAWREFGCPDIWPGPKILDNMLAVQAQDEHTGKFLIPYFTTDFIFGIPERMLEPMEVLGNRRYEWAACDCTVHIVLVGDTVNLRFQVQDFAPVLPVLPRRIKPLDDLIVKRP